MEILGFKIERIIKPKEIVIEPKKSKILKDIKTFFKAPFLELKKTKNSYINIITDRITLTTNKGNIKELNPLKLKDLTANALEEENNIYVETLYWGFIKNNIQNIAITGYYGTGKSTIINTFISKHVSIKYLKISLAKFKEDETFTNDLEIENSILQQLFYSTKQKTLSESRNKRIKYTKFLIPKVAFFLTWINSFVFIFFPIILSKITIYETDLNINRIFKIIFIIGICIVIYFFFKSILTLKITKLSLNDAEVTPTANNETSALNKNFDEILYYFERTKTKIVFIEDLDRFNKPEIFVKLREINSLINNCNDIKHPVKFIYAIKDELFTESEKTKFFDLIIPVIPFINSKSSNIFLSKELETFNIEKELLKIISPNISDMRTLKNICNEFKIYNQIKSEEINNEGVSDYSNSKLLALIVYKNIYPDDFSKIQLDKGLLNFIFEKTKLVETFQANILEKVTKNITDIENSEKEFDLSIEELKKVYIIEIIKFFPKNAMQFFAEGVIDKFELLNDEYSEQIINSPTNTIYYCTQKSKDYFNNASYKEALIDANGNEITFKYVEEKIGKKFSFRKENILNKKESKKNKILKNNKILSEEIAHIQSTSLKDFYEKESSSVKTHILQQIKKNITNENLNPKKSITKVEETEDKNNTEKETEERKLRIETQRFNLLINLLETGYIDENYHHYISKFHTGSLTQKENSFLKYILDNDIPKFSEEIDNIENFIEEIPDFKFKKSVILNYEILSHLLLKHGDNYYSNKLTLFVNNLKNYSDLTNNFYNGFFSFIKEKENKTEVISLFIERFCFSWDEFIFSILNNSYINSEDKKTIFETIINLNPTLLIGQNHNLYLTNFINENNEFIDCVELNSSDFIIELINSLKELNIKFKSIKYLEEKKSFFNDIFKNNLYEINVHNIEEIIFNIIKNVKKEEFNESPYTFIKQSNLKELINYVSREDNLESFVINVLNKIESNKKESESIVKEILLSSISDETKENFLKNQLIVFKNIEVFKNIDNQDLLLKLNKIIPNWDNVFHYYKNIKEFGFEIDEHLVMFLNIENNYKTLAESKIELKSKKILDDNETIKLFIDIINSNISNESLKSIINKERIEISNLNDYKINIERIDFLVKHKIIETNSENFNFLKKEKSVSRIELIQNEKSVFLNDMEEFNLDNTDFILLMNSKELLENRNTIIKHFDSNDLFDLTKQDESKEIYTFFIKNNQILCSEKLLESLLKIIPEVENKIIIFNRHFKTLNDSKINEMINIIGNPFIKILSAEEFYIINNSINMELCDKLKQKGLIKPLKRKDKIFVKY